MDGSSIEIDEATRRAAELMIEHRAMLVDVLGKEAVYEIELARKREEAELMDEASGAEE